MAEEETHAGLSKLNSMHQLVTHDMWRVERRGPTPLDAEHQARPDSVDILGHSVVAGGRYWLWNKFHCQRRRRGSERAPERGSLERR
jgi:hypothetical protein